MVLKWLPLNCISPKFNPNLGPWIPSSSFALIPKCSLYTQVTWVCSFFVETHLDSESTRCLHKEKWQLTLLHHRWTPAVHWTNLAASSILAHSCLEPGLPFWQFHQQIVEVAYPLALNLSPLFQSTGFIEPQCTIQITQISDSACLIF